jgi:hypothetical protein
VKVQNFRYANGLEEVQPLLPLARAYPVSRRLSAMRSHRWDPVARFAERSDCPGLGIGWVGQSMWVGDVSAGEIQIQPAFR